MIFMPPRHYKTEMVTVRYTAWRIEREPSLRVILGAYNQTLADKFSRKCRRVVRERGVTLNDERTAVQDWETTKGGGLRAVGVGAGIAGQGAKLILLDDPVKSREEAESEAYRDRVYEWYTDDIYTRQEGKCSIILIMTRWHEDDLAGRILASEDGPDWTVISLPAEAEEDDPLGRDVGDALCPDLFNKEALLDRRRVLGNGYYALYQQRPQPREGSLFKRHWFEIVSAAPVEASRARYWDNASTEMGGDYTAGVKIARTNEGMFYIEDVIRGQWSTNQREMTKLQAAVMDGSRVRIWQEQEPGSGGKDSARATIRHLHGFIVHAEPVTGDKVVRAEPLASQCEAGNVKIVKGDWNAAFINELCSFPSGMNDDQVDAASGAFNKLAKQSIKHKYEKSPF